MPAIKGDGTFGSGVGASLLPPLDARFNTLTLPTIAIMSFGEMGMGIAALLSRYSYPVVTCLEGRSQKTQTRALSIEVKNLPFAEMVHTASIFLSIVPPAEAEPLAFRTVQALQSNHIRAKPLVYMDLNAISPRLSRDVAEILKSTETLYIDGAIIGFPPRELDDKTWFRPAITLSGPSLESTNELWTEHLISLLNIRHVGDDIGAASGLKMCFGAIYKGQAAIGIQAYTTAKNLGVLPALRGHMAEYFPTTTPILESSLIGSQKKAYRWIKEMDEIQETFATEGGWGPDLFSGVSDVFQLVSQKTDLGNTSRSDVVEVTEEISKAVKEVK